MNLQTGDQDQLDDQFVLSQQVNQFFPANMLVNATSFDEHHLQKYRPPTDSRSLIESSELDNDDSPLSKDELAAKQETSFMIASLKHSNSICDEQVDQKPTTALNNFCLGGAPFESLDRLNHRQKPFTTTDQHIDAKVSKQESDYLKQELMGMPEVKRRRTKQRIHSHGRNEAELLKMPTSHTSVVSAG